MNTDFVSQVYIIRTELHDQNKNTVVAKTRSLWEWMFALFLLPKWFAVNWNQPKCDSAAFGLDTYSSVYLFGPHFDLYQSLNRLPIWNSQNCSMFPLAFVAGWLQGHWWGFISRNYVVWPTFFLMNVYIALKGSHFWFYICNKSGENPLFAHVLIARSGYYSYNEL